MALSIIKNNLLGSYTCISVVLFYFLLYKVVLNFEFADAILNYDYSNESYCAAISLGGV